MFQFQKKTVEVITIDLKSLGGYDFSKNTVEQPYKMMFNLQKLNRGSDKKNNQPDVKDQYAAADIFGMKILKGQKNYKDEKELARDQKKQAIEAYEQLVDKFQQKQMKADNEVAVWKFYMHL